MVAVESNQLQFVLYNIVPTYNTYKTGFTVTVLIMVKIIY